MTTGNDGSPAVPPYEGTPDGESPEATTGPGHKLGTPEERTRRR
jgi:hypothetical protein